MFYKNRFGCDKKMKKKILAIVMICLLILTIFSTFSVSAFTIKKYESRRETTKTTVNENSIITKNSVGYKWFSVTVKDKYNRPVKGALISLLCDMSFGPIIGPIGFTDRLGEHNFWYYRVNEYYPVVIDASYKQGGKVYTTSERHVRSETGRIDILLQFDDLAVKAKNCNLLLERLLLRPILSSLLNL
jgi:hypothetical protein